jgi:hypothetical protein
MAKGKGKSASSTAQGGPMGKKIKGQTYSGGRRSGRRKK